MPSVGTLTLCAPTARQVSELPPRKVLVARCARSYPESPSCPGSPTSELSDRCQGAEMRYREGPPQRAPPGANVTGDACSRSGRAGAGDRPQVGSVPPRQSPGRTGWGRERKTPTGLQTHRRTRRSRTGWSCWTLPSRACALRVVARSAPKWALLPLHLPLLLPGSGHSQRPRPPAHGKVLGTRRKPASKRQPPSGLCLHFLLHQMTRCCCRRRRYLFLCALRPSPRCCWLACPRGSGVGGWGSRCLPEEDEGWPRGGTHQGVSRESGLRCKRPWHARAGTRSPARSRGALPAPHWVLAFPGDTFSSLGTPGGEGGETDSAPSSRFPPPQLRSRAHTKETDAGAAAAAATAGLTAPGTPECWLATDRAGFTGLGERA